MGFTYNGTHSDVMGVVVTGIRRDLLPPIAARTITVPGRPGAYWQGYDYDIRQFEVEVFVRGASLADLRAKVRGIADWLNAHGGPKPLVFDDEPDKQYYAVLSNETALEQILWYGRGTLTFLCPDPHAYSTTEKTYIIDVGEGEKTITNDGTAAAYPVIRAYVQRPTTFLSVATADRQILLGKPDSVETAPVERETRILYDQLTSTTGWVDGTTVDGGVVAGSFYSDGADLRVQSYGTGSQWHGPSLKKSLSEALTDFRLTVWTTLKNRSGKVGRAEVYLLDQNGAVIGKMALVDRLASVDDVWAEVRAGSLSNGVYFVNTHGVQTGVWNDFYGVLQVERVGNVWRAFIGMFDTAKQRYHTRWTAQYVDVNNQFAAQLAQVQLHAATYDTFTPCDVIFHAVVVDRINTMQETQISYIATAGDVLEIDCERAVIRKNGMVDLSLLDVASRFPRLEPKTGTTFGVAPEDAAIVEITFRERWL